MAIARNVRSRHIHAQAKCDELRERYRNNRLPKFLQRRIGCIAISRAEIAILKRTFNPYSHIYPKILIIIMSNKYIFHLLLLSLHILGVMHSSKYCSSLPGG